MIAAVAATLAGLVALAAYAEGWLLALAVLVAQLVLMAGWYRFAAVPGERAGLAVCVPFAFLANFLPIWRSGDTPLAPLAPVLGLAFLAAVVAQLVRRYPRERLTESLAATVTAAVLLVTGALYVPAGDSIGGATLVAAAVAASASAPLTESLPIPALARTLLAVGLGGALGAVIGSTSESVGAASGALVGLAAGLTSSLGTGLLAFAPTGRRTDVTLVEVAHLPRSADGCSATPSPPRARRPTSTSHWSRSPSSLAPPTAAPQRRHLRELGARPRRHTGRGRPAPSLRRRLLRNAVTSASSAPDLDVTLVEVAHLPRSADGCSATPSPPRARRPTSPITVAASLPIVLGGAVAYVVGRLAIG